MAQSKQVHRQSPFPAPEQSGTRESSHFAGSACGAGMSGKPSSTIAFEKRWNPLLSKPREEFIDALCDVPPKPAEMSRMLQINQGRLGQTP